MTFAPQGNENKILFSVCLPHIVSDFDCFAETSVAAALSIKAPSESVIDPPSVDPWGLNYLYHKVLQFKTSSVSELLMTAGVGSAPIMLLSKITMPVLEPATEPYVNSSCFFCFCDFPFSGSY